MHEKRLEGKREVVNVMVDNELSIVGQPWFLYLNQCFLKAMFVTSVFLYKFRYSGSILTDVAKTS